MSGTRKKVRFPLFQVGTAGQPGIHLPTLSALVLVVTWGFGARRLIIEGITPISVGLFSVGAFVAFVALLDARRVFPDGVAETLIGLVLLCALTLVSAGSGGLLAPAAPWILLLPPLALLEGGPRHGTVFVVLTGAGLGVLTYFTEGQGTEPMVRFSCYLGSLFFLHVIASQAELRRSSAFRRIIAARADLHEVLRRTPVGMVVANGDKVSFANRAFVETLGERPEKSVVGAKLSSLMKPHSARALTDLVASECTGEERELRFESLAGAHVSTRAINVGHVELSTGAGCLLIVRDVTTELHASARLRTMDQLATVGSLAAGVAHEVNNPLTSVLDHIARTKQLIEKEKNRPPPIGASHTDECIDLLKDAQEGALRIKKVITDLSVFLESEPALSPCGRGSFKVQKVVETCGELLRASGPSNVRLRLDMQDSPLFAAGEAGRFAHTVMALFNNAVEALGRAPESAQVIEAKVVSHQDGALIEVSDSGPGIPETIRGRVFDPFFSTKSETYGVGLGLTAAHQFAVAAGGWLTVANHAQRGVTARLWLPSQKQVSQSPPAATPRTSARILIIDDEPLICEVLLRYCEDHQVDTAAEGDEGLRLARENDYDIILCDLMMPQITGMDLYSTLKAEAPEKARRMVFITGGTVSEQSRDFVANAEQPVLYKPFGQSVLDALLARFIPHGQPEASREPEVATSEAAAAMG